MIEEAYVSKEVAELLLEKGFDEPCHFYYKKGIHTPYLNDFGGLRITNSEYKKAKVDKVSAPTQQMAMRWLREVYDIDIIIKCVWQDGLFPYSFKITSHNPHKIIRNPEITVFFNHYEETVNYAIKYCCEKLI